jgi:branched-subunit amino acid transport protein
MNIWILMIVIGGLTLVGRMSFLVLFGQREMPSWAMTALRYVPVTALTALAMPAIMLNNGRIDLSLNPRIFAALVAMLVAWKTQNILATITAGMLVFWITQFLMGT